MGTIGVVTLNHSNYVSPRNLRPMQIPAWIPVPRAWVNAIATILLMFGLYRLFLLALKYINIPGDWFNLVYLIYLLVILAPIAFIAFLHHWLHKFLDAFFPETRTPEVDGESGTSPNIFSWWQGFYGSFVNYFSWIVSICIVGLFMPSPYVSDIFNLFTSNHQFRIDTLTIVRIAVQIIIAASMYQIEFLLHQRLMASGRR